MAIFAKSRDLPPKFFNVVHYGAVADGTTDNSQVSFKLLALVYSVQKEDRNQISFYFWYYIRHFLKHGKMHVHIMGGVGFGFQVGDSC